MPGLNQKGPMGQGPLSGRRMGRCTNFGATQKKENIESSEKPGENLPENFPGRGFGAGRGFGRGRGMGRQNRFRGGE